MAVISLTKVYNPLDRSNQDTAHYEFVPGDTLAVLIDNAKVRELVSRDSLQLMVSVNGIHIPEEKWHQVRITEGQCITLVPVLTGGGDTGKTVARMVGMIVLMVVAWYAAPAIVAAMGGTFSATGAAVGFGTQLAVGLVSAVIMAGGSMLLNAALGSSRSSNPALNGYAGMDQTNSYSWNPSTTQQQGIVIPWHYGICKITGNIIGVYRENIGDKQYLNALISLGEGPLSAPYDIKINNQDYTHFTGVTLYTRLGHLQQELIPNFADTRIEYAVSYKVENGTPVTYTTVGLDFDTLEIQVTFPNGLGHYADSGALENYSVDFSVEVKKTTDSVWTHIAQSTAVTTPSSQGYWSKGRWETYTEADGGRIWTETVWREMANGGTVYADHYEGESVTEFTWRWIGTSIPLASTIVDFIHATAKQRGPLNYTYRLNNLEAGTYDVRVTNLTGDQSDQRYLDDFYLTAVREITLDDFTYPGEALIGIRALANDQLSGSFSFECKSAGKMCRVYNGTAWSVAATSNPAWVTFDILTQPVFDGSFNILEYRAHNPANINITRFLEWAEYCDDLVPDGHGGLEARLTWNGQFDSSRTMWDAALIVSKIGRAVPYWQGTTLSVAIDKPADPVTLISVGNIGLDSFEEIFLNMENRAGMIDADFINSESGFDRDKVTVINPAAPSGWGTASLALQGVIKPSEAYRHCMYHLATTQNLVRVVTVQMDIDSIAFTLGDIINVQHDVPMWGEGGRLVSATTTQVVLDKEVTIVAGHTYNIMVRLLDGTIVERAISTGAGTTNTLTVAIPFTAAPVAYDVYAFGETSILVKPMRVNGIDPAGDLKRRITMTDYNSTVWNSDLGTPVIRTPNYTSNTLPTITGLTLSEHLVLNQAGIITPMLDIKWDVVTNRTVRYVELFVNGISKGLFDQSTNSTSFATDELQLYMVLIRCVGWLGDRQPMSSGATASITLLGKTAPPANVANLRASATSFGGLILTWDAVADVDLDHYAIRWCATTTHGWENAIDIGSAYTTTITIPAALDGIYLIKAVDTSAIESLVAASVITTIPSLINYNAIATADDGADWIGAKVNCYASGGKLRLDMAGVFDDIADFDALINIDTYGGALSEGYYTISSTVDLGVIQTSRCAVAVDYEAVDTSLYFDSMLDFDAIKFFDGDAAPGVMVQPQIRLSQNGTDWSDWQAFIAGDYTAMQLQFRLRLSTNIIYNIPEVTAFSVSVDMPDRAERGQGVSVAAGGTAITFTKLYMVAPIIRTTIQGATSGDTEKITSISASGFTIQILNGGSGVARTVDWQSVGY